MRRLAVMACMLALGALAHAGGPGVGDPAPAFTLPDRDGRQVALSELRGKVVCLDFWATWCATCKAALPALDALARRPGFEDVRFLAVNVDRDRTLADRWVAQHLPNPKLTMLRDGNALLARLGAEGMPALYVIDREGVIRHVEAGYETAALKQVETALDALIAPRP